MSDMTLNVAAPAQGEADATVRVSVTGSIATITLSRPAKRNALDLDMLAALLRACDEVEANDVVRVAILTGEAATFCAGGDILAWGAMDAGEFGHLWVRHGHRVMDRVATLRVPVIAAINGHAFGGGLELAAAADMRIGEEHIRLGLPEAGLGMVPGWSGTQRLVRRFGQQIVRRMALGAEIFSAGQAQSAGLLDNVVPTGTVLAAAQEAASRIAQRAPRATEMIKLMLSVASDEDRGAAVETLGSIALSGTPDMVEGVNAFRQKRPAHFKGDWS